MESPRVEYDPNGIAWVVFDDPESKVNLLSPTTVGQLDKILDELSQRKPKGVVFISAKPDIFIAGADIKELEKIRDAEHGEQLSRAGHRILAKIKELGVPSVAAIDGACLGGGCELALACRHRVATDNPKTQIGLPETQLGIIPGWGGTQRLPRLIGLRAALDIICAGKSVSADKARRIGLVDAGGAGRGLEADRRQHHSEPRQEGCSQEKVPLGQRMAVPPAHLSDRAQAGVGAHAWPLSGAGARD